MVQINMKYGYSTSVIHPIIIYTCIYVPFEKNRKVSASHYFSVYVAAQNVTWSPFYYHSFCVWQVLTVCWMYHVHEGLWEGSDDGYLLLYL